jgi:hypothetical protein
MAHEGDDSLKPFGQIGETSGTNGDAIDSPFLIIVSSGGGDHPKEAGARQIWRG